MIHLLAQDLVSSFLPMLSKREAGDIAFTGMYIHIQHTAYNNRHNYTPYTD
jgi:hypothetical protein